MELDFCNETAIELDDYYPIYERLLDKTLKVLNKTGEYVVSVTFVNIDKIHEINKKFRDVDRETDVISFAFLDDKKEIIKGNIPIDLGEIYICYDIALRNSISYGNTINRELSFLFVHGLLHLFGYNHIKKEDEEIMFPLQEEILKKE